MLGAIGSALGVAAAAAPKELHGAITGQADGGFPTRFVSHPQGPCILWVRRMAEHPLLH